MDRHTGTTRRTFLAGLAGLSTLAASGILAACGDTATAPTPTGGASGAATTGGTRPTIPVLIPPTAPPATAVPAMAPAGMASAPPMAAAMPPAAPTAAPMAAAARPVKRGGQLRLMQINDFVSMDPIHASGPTARGVYDALVAWRPNAMGQYGVQPMLAQSWETKGNALTLKLRPGVKFHDGSDLNADVVVWNIKRMVQNAKSFAANPLQAIDKMNPAQALDPMTVQINLKQPSAAVLPLLSDVSDNMYIVSKKAADDRGEESLKTNPVGTGPYTFVSFNSGDKLVLKKNENYWMMGSDGRALPYTDGVTYRVIIEATTQFNEMRAGTADLMSNVRGRDVPAAKQIASARYIESPFSGVKRQYFFNAAKGPFKDNVKLRQAVHHAIDREAMARALGAGLGVVVPYELVPGEIGHSDKVPFHDFNLDKARTLLRESGVSTPVNVRLTVHSREVDQQQAQLIQAMLDKIGIKINIDVVERTAWGDKVRLMNDFEMATRQTGVKVDPTDDLLITWAEEGNSAYHRAKVSGLIDTIKQADAEYDLAKRQELFVKAQTLMYESAWFGYMWFETGNFLIHKRVQGFAQPWGALRESEWWIDE